MRQNKQYVITILLLLFPLLSGCGSGIAVGLGNSSFNIEMQTGLQTAVQAEETGSGMSPEEVKQFLLDADSALTCMLGPATPDSIYKAIARYEGYPLFKRSDITFDEVLMGARKYYASDELVEFEYNKHCFIIINGEIGFNMDLDGADSYFITDDSNVRFLLDREDKIIVEVEVENGSGALQTVEYVIEKRSGNWLITNEIGFMDYKTDPDKLIVYCTDSFAAEASSTLRGYPAENVLDGDQDTAWAEGTGTSGIGEWILLKAEKPVAVSGLEIMNGYNKEPESGASSGDEIYASNNRLKELKIEFSDQSARTFLLEDGVFGYDAFQYLKFDQPVTTEYIKITILGVYPGSKYDDTCISEVRVY